MFSNLDVSLKNFFLQPGTRELLVPMFNIYYDCYGCFPNNLAIEIGIKVMTEKSSAKLKQKQELEIFFNNLKVSLALEMQIGEYKLAN